MILDTTAARSALPVLIPFPSETHTTLWPVIYFPCLRTTLEMEATMCRACTGFPFWTLYSTWDCSEARTCCWPYCFHRTLWAYLRSVPSTQCSASLDLRQACALLLAQESCSPPLWCQHTLTTCASDQRLPFSSSWICPPGSIHLSETLEQVNAETSGLSSMALGILMLSL